MHERAFRLPNPAKKGYKGTINPFPQHVPDPPVEKKRVIKNEDAEEIPAFKMTKKTNTRPTPSIATNVRNLKASFPAMFRR